MKRNILLLGYYGFLGKAIRNSDLFKDYNFIDYPVPRIHWNIYKETITKLKELNITEIWNFAGPSGNDNEDTSEIVKGNEKMIYLCNELEVPYLYASTAAIDYDEFTDYSISKHCSEASIKCHVKNSYKILRIPRVYGIDKEKGLFKMIKNNQIDNWNNKVTYTTIDEFLKSLNNNIIFDNSIYHFDDIKYYTNTIKEIKEKFKI